MRTGLLQKGPVSRRGAMTAVLLLVLAACGKDSPTSPPVEGAPVFTPLGPVSVNEVSRTSYDVSATDAEGDSLTLSLTGAPGFAGIVDHGDGTGTLTLSPELGDAGSYTIRVRAFDGKAAGFDTVDVTVTAVAEASLFYEPPSLCRSGDPDTLLVWNEGNETLLWQPVSGPADAGGLLDRLEVPVGTIFGVVVDWNPPGPFPVLDTLRVLTNDPSRPAVEIPLRAEAPGFIDILAPDAPLLRIPADGAVFALNAGTQEVEIPVDWSDVDDCSGLAFYLLQISSTGNFSPPDVSFRIEPLSPGDPPPSEALLVAESADVGKAYWRVIAQDKKGFLGTPSEVRSWTVVGSN